MFGREGWATEDELNAFANTHTVMTFRKVFMLRMLALG